MRLHSTRLLTEKLLTQRWKNAAKIAKDQPKRVVPMRNSTKGVAWLIGEWPNIAPLTPILLQMIYFDGPFRSIKHLGIRDGGTLDYFHRVTIINQSTIVSCSRQMMRTGKYYQEMSITSDTSTCNITLWSSIISLQLTNSIWHCIFFLLQKDCCS